MLTMFIYILDVLEGYNANSV